MSAKTTLYRLLEALPGWGIVLDRHRRVVWFDRAAKKGLKWRRKQVVGMRLEKIPPFSALRIQADEVDRNTPLCLQLEGGMRCFLAEMIPYSKKYQLLLLRKPGGALLQEVSQREFVANASHELRTPLTLLNGYLEQLSSGEVPQRWQRPLEVMTLQGDRMLQIVEDMLLLSGLEQKRKSEHSHQEIVDVGSLIDELIESHSILIKKKKQQLILEVETGLWLKGVPSILRSAFSNLIVNSIKYTQKRGEITISWGLQQKTAHFMVRDNGPGIPLADQERLTERFYRVDKGRSRELGGTGLGLSIVQGALQAHGGELQIESQPGQGSCFIARFPENCVQLKK